MANSESQRMAPNNPPEDVALIGTVGGAIAGGALGTIVGPLGTLAGALLGGVIGEEFERRMRIETEQGGQMNVSQAITESEGIEYTTVNITEGGEEKELIDNLDYDLSDGETITLPHHHARSLIDKGIAEDIRSVYSDMRSSVEGRNQREQLEKSQPDSIPKLPLKEIRLEGFRNFGQMTTIQFEEGLTVITGPNGSGKSNLIHGISFALGYPHKQRFSEADLKETFHQPNSETTVDEANVTVVLDNSSGEISHSQLTSLVKSEAIEDVAEISIKNRLKKKDEHVYSYFYINGRSVDLVDIQRLLEHADLGPREYNIITQDDITNTIQMSAQERRNILEEISGVDGYNNKIKDAREQLEVVEEAINEVDIRIDERRRVLDSQDLTRSDLEDLKKHREELAEEQDKIRFRIEGYKKYKKETFEQEHKKINSKFTEIIEKISNNTGSLHLTGEGDSISGGLEIRIGENEEKLQEFKNMSGAEKALGALAFLLALQYYRPSPFVVLDEVDAFLNAAHVEALGVLVDDLSEEIQVIAVSHRQAVVDKADQVIDVSLDPENETKGLESQSRGTERIDP